MWNIKIYEKLLCKFMKLKFPNLHSIQIKTYVPPYTNIKNGRGINNECIVYSKGN